MEVVERVVKWFPFFCACACFRHGVSPGPLACRPWEGSVSSGFVGLLPAALPEPRPPVPPCKAPDLLHLLHSQAGKRGGCNGLSAAEPQLQVHAFNPVHHASKIQFYDRHYWIISKRISDVLTTDNSLKLLSVAFLHLNRNEFFISNTSYHDIKSTNTMQYFADSNARVTTFWSAMAD